MKSFKIPSIYTAIDKVTAPLRKMTKSVSEFAARNERALRQVNSTAKSVAKTSFITGLAIAAPLALAANDAIKFEDMMADVGKTTGIAGKELQFLGKDLIDLSLSSRTTIEEFQQIAAIGGAMGVAKGELLSFTDSVNKFNVALGSDFGGGVEEASRAIAGLKTLFKETRDIDVATSITKTGSAINALSSKGVNVPELTEFVSRVGQLPDAIKPSLQNTAALGAVMNKVGITAEIASRAFGDILLTGAANLPGFAKQMGLTTKAASELLNTDPTKFASVFAKSFEGKNAEQLSKILKKLKLTDAGAIKVVGALASNTKMLSEFQAISNKEFEKGTSLLDEYNTKNNTTRANVLKAQNNFRALSITLGTELLPVITDLIKSVAPYVKSTLEWMRANPRLTKTIIYLGISLAALSFIVSGVSSAIAIGTSVIMAFQNVTKIATAAQWLLNAAMTANPIGLIIVAIGLLITMVTLMISKWDEWGAALAFVSGPLGLIVSIVQSLREHWDGIVQSFTNGDILKGFAKIGFMLMETILVPLQQVLELVGKATGFDLASNAANSIQNLRKNIGAIIETQNPSQARQEGLSRTVQENIQRQNVAIDINDNTGRASVDRGNNLIPINLTSTSAF